MILQRNNSVNMFNVLVIQLNTSCSSKLEFLNGSRSPGDRTLMVRTHGYYCSSVNRFNPIQMKRVLIVFIYILYIQKKSTNNVHTLVWFVRSCCVI